MVFHGFVVLGIVPLENIWGGQIQSRNTLIVAEIVAISITAFFMMIVAVRAGYFQIEGYAKLFGFGAWFMFAFFALNTLGNLSAETLMEKVVFTPITLCLMFCARRLAMGEQS